MKFKTRTAIAWLVLLAPLTIIIALHFKDRPSHESPQPIYAGRPFSAWLADVSVVPDDTDPAIEAIRQMGAAALPHLLQALAVGKIDRRTSTSGHHQPWEIRDRAARALKGLGSNAEPLVPSIVGLLKSTDARIRAHAAEILGHTDLASDVIIAALLEALKDDEAAYQASLSLGRLGRSHTNVLQHLITFAQGPDRAAVSWATVSMEEIGPAARPALELLGKLARSPSFDTRVAAVKTIALIGSNAVSAVPVLTNALADSEPWVRKCAAIALGRIGPGARTAISPLHGAFSHEESDYTRVDMARALWRIDQGQLEVVLPLTYSIFTNNLRLAQESNSLPYALTSALDLLGEFGSNAATALPLILKLVESEEALLRFNAAWAGWQIAPAQRTSMVGVLEKLLEVEEYPVDPALAKGGPVGQALAEPKRQRESFPIRMAAAGALWQTDFADRKKLRTFTAQLLREWTHWTSMKAVIPEERVLVPLLHDLMADPNMKEIYPIAAGVLSDLTGPRGERW